MADCRFEPAEDPLHPERLHCGTHGFYHDDEEGWCLGADEPPPPMDAWTPEEAEAFGVLDNVAWIAQTDRILARAVHRAPDLKMPTRLS